MEVINEYLNLKSSYKEYYLKNNHSIDNTNISAADLFYYVGSDVDLVFSALNISPSKSGYKYWKDAIFLLILSTEISLSICNDIYPAIAKKYNKSSMAIERAMRLCFENVLFYISKNKTNLVGEYLKNSLLYPHNREILVKIVEFIVSENFQNNKNKLVI